MKKIFIGIDFSKEKFDATLIQAEGLKECAPSVHEVFDNKTSGYRRLVKWVQYIFFQKISIKLHPIIFIWKQPNNMD